MERKLFPGLMALMFFAAPLGCNGPETGDTNGTDTMPDDSGDPVDSITVNVTVHAAIDGVRVDPVGVCLHEAAGTTGEEAVLATAEVTGQAITVNVLKSGEQARVWIGPASAEKSSDGHRILEYDGRQWVHPIADFTINEDGCDETTMNMVDSEGCEPTVNENGYFNEFFHCVNDTFGYDASDPEYKGEYAYTQEGEHALEVTNGKDIVDPDGLDLDGFLTLGDCALESSGSGFTVVGDDCDQWMISSSWNGDGFTVLTAFSDEFVTEYTCTAQ